MTSPYYSQLDDRKRRSRSELRSTETLDKLMVALASTGESNQPVSDRPSALLYAIASARPALISGSHVFPRQTTSSERPSRRSTNVVPESAAFVARSDG